MTKAHLRAIAILFLLLQKNGTKRSTEILEKPNLYHPQYLGKVQRNMHDLEHPQYLRSS